MMSADRLVEKNARVQAARRLACCAWRAEYLDELIRALGKAATKDLARVSARDRPERPALFANQPKSAAARAELADVFGLMGDRAALPALEELQHRRRQQRRPKRRTGDPPAFGRNRALRLAFVEW